MPQHGATRTARTETLAPLNPAAVLPAAFLAGSFFYVWLRVEPVLDYHRFGPFFYARGEFFERFLDRPGGLVDYAGVWLAQANHFNWAGALVFFLLQLGIYLATRVVLGRVSGVASGWAALLPAFGFLLLRNRYGVPVTAVGLGLLLALGASAAQVSLAWRRPWKFAFLSACVSGLLFWVAGLWPALLFSACNALFARVRLRNGLAGLGCMLLALAPPGGLLATGNYEAASLANSWTGTIGWGLLAFVYGALPAVAVLLAMIHLAAGPVRRGQAEGVEEGGIPWAGWAVTLLVLLLASAVAGTQFDRREKLFAQIDYYAGSGEFEKVLAAASHARVLNHPARVRLQFALFHTGRLAEDLFSFINRVDLEPSEKIGEDWRAQARPLLELGLVNDAEHMAHEALEIQGDRPDLLRLLARINLLKDRPKAAQVFLNVLSLIPFQGDSSDANWPGGEPRIDATERAWLDPMRARLLTKDVPHDSVRPLLDVSLFANPTNRMAFEYVMAHYLTELDLKTAAERLGFIGNFGYAHIPRPYEEALLLYQQLAGVTVELNGRSIRPETVARFRHFREFGRRLNGTAEELGVMATHFGDTYWCYYYAHLIRKRAAQRQASAP